MLRHDHGKTRQWSLPSAQKLGLWLSAGGGAEGIERKALGLVQLFFPPPGITFQASQLVRSSSSETQMQLRVHAIIPSSKTFPGFRGGENPRREHSSDHLTLSFPTSLHVAEAHFAPSSPPTIYPSR